MATKTTETAPTQRDAAAATAVLEAQKKARVEACTAEIEAALGRHGCLLFGYAVLAPGRVDVRIEVQAQG